MKTLRLVFVILLMGQLTGCGSVWEGTKKVGAVMFDPSIPVGAPKDLPTQLTYSIVAEEDVNQNPNGDPAPIEFQLFELEDDSKLLAADYDSLVSDFEDALGSNYIDHSDFTMLPGQFKFIEPFEVDEDTRYIGVIAHFGDPEVSQWKKVIKIKSIGREYHVLILFKDQEVLLDRVE